MKTVTVCAARALSAGGTWTSSAIHITSGWFWDWTIQVIVTGSGTLKLEFATSLNGLNFVTNSTAICSTLAAASTPILYTPTIELAPWIKFILTEDGTSDALAATVIACYA